LETNVTASEAINEAIELAQKEGNSIVEISTGWEKVREVAIMAQPLSDHLRKTLGSDLRLRFWRASGTPHNRDECGFTDDARKVAVSFPTT